MGPIVLAKDFSFVADAGQTLLGDWLELGELSQFQNANVHVHCQTYWPTGGPGGLRMAIETSYDEVGHPVAGGSLAVTGIGSSDRAISANLADKVRLTLTNNKPTQLMGILSVWLQLKSE